MPETLLLDYNASTSGSVPVSISEFKQFALRMVLANGTASATGQLKAFSNANTLVGTLTAEANSTNLSLTMSADEYARFPRFGDVSITPSGGTASASISYTSKDDDTFSLKLPALSTTYASGSSVTLLSSESSVNIGGSNINFPADGTTASVTATNLASYINTNTSAVTAVVDSTDNTLVNLTSRTKGFNGNNISLSSSSSSVSVNSYMSGGTSTVPATSGTFSFDLKGTATSLDGSIGGVSLLQGSSPFLVIGGSGNSGSDVLIMLKLESPLPLNKIFATWSGVATDNELIIYLNSD